MQIQARPTSRGSPSSTLRSFHDHGERQQKIRRAPVNARSCVKDERLQKEWGVCSRKGQEISKERGRPRDEERTENESVVNGRKRTARSYGRAGTTYRFSTPTSKRHKQGISTRIAFAFPLALPLLFRMRKLGNVFLYVIRSELWCLLIAAMSPDQRLFADRNGPSTRSFIGPFWR